MVEDSSGTPKAEYKGNNGQPINTPEEVKPYMKHITTWFTSKEVKDFLRKELQHFPKQDLALLSQKKVKVLSNIKLLSNNNHYNKFLI